MVNDGDAVGGGDVNRSGAVLGNGPNGDGLQPILFTPHADFAFFHHGDT